MISILAFNRETLEFTTTQNSQEISDLCDKGSNIVWVDVSDPTSADFIELAEEFGFHPLSIEDSRKQHQRPKVEEFTGYYFIVLYEVGWTPETGLELRELHIFLGRNYLVTVHSTPIQAISTAERLWREWKQELAERGTGLLAYLLMDSVVDNYFPVLDSMSDKIDDLEDRIFIEYHQDTIEDMFRIKKHLLFLRRAVTPLRDVFNTLLRREQPIFSRDTVVYFQDVFDHLIRVSDTIDSLRDMVGAAMDAFLSISGNRTNMVMKRLTSISAILMSVTLIAGIFGMNFVYMPELGWRYGYVAALLSMVIIGLAIYLYFRKIRWL
jgi:magnesium transporter